MPTHMTESTLDNRGIDQELDLFAEELDDIRLTTEGLPSTSLLACSASFATAASASCPAVCVSTASSFSSA